MPDPEEEIEEEPEVRGGRLKRYGRGVARSPYAAYEKIIGGGGFLKKVIKWFFAWSIVLLLIAGIAVVAIFFIRCNQTGTCGVVLSSIFGGLEKVGAVRATEAGALTLMDYIWNPDKVAESLMFTWEEKQVEEEKFGVKITDFEMEEMLYYTKDPISAVATVNVKAPEDEDITIDFFDACELQDYKGEIEVSAPFTEEKEIIVLAGTEDDFDVTCKFLDGFEDLDKDISRKKVTFKPRYDFLQNVEWYVKSKYSKSVDDEKVGATIAIKGGPMILKLNSKSRQPFYVGKSYKLFFELENNKLIWGGRLDKVEDIRLKLPFNVELITDEFCDFTERGSRGDYRTYVLKEDKLEKINIDCSLKEFLTEYDLTMEGCIKLLKDNIKASCEFKFLDAEEEVSVGLPFIAEVSYTYFAEDIAFANIRMMEFKGES